MQRFGTQYGGFTYPRNLPHLNASSVIYCVGVGEDVSHDVEISRALGGATVHLFDPTPRAVAHVEKVKSAVQSGTRPPNDKREGGGDPHYWDRILDSKRGPLGDLVFRPYALDATDGTREFYAPLNRDHVSHSFFQSGSRAKDGALHVECKSLASIMREFGHTRVDLLKIDIEGAEIDVIGQLLDAYPETSQWPVYLAVDFDSARAHINGGRAAAEAILSRLAHHYVVCHNHDWDISFVRRDCT